MIHFLQQVNVSKDGMMAYLQIPKIDVKLPIYHSTSNGILQKGVGHMEGSSLPIGGTSTHAVLSGHRGLPNSKLFTDLDKIKVGDIFYISVLGDTLAYEVDQIKTVLPSQTDDIEIVDGEDYVTLVTCTPYSVNTHRLLVRGKRTDYKEAIKKTPNKVNNGIQIPYEVKLALLSFIIIGIIIFIWRRR